MTATSIGVAGCGGSEDGAEPVTAVMNLPTFEANPAPGPGQTGTPGPVAPSNPDPGQAGMGGEFGGTPATPGDGNPGMPGDSVPGDGNPGVPGDGVPGDGNPGMPGDGNPGVPGDGVPGDGAPGDGMPGDGDVGDGDGAPGDGDGSTGNGDDIAALGKFSFFVTSLEVMRELSGSQDGFGGDLGGLEGADSICQQAAEKVGFGAKTWRAFLSATDDGNGNPVHAIDRVGDGPWYDRNERLIAMDKQGLLSERPAGDPQAVNDLPNEYGEGLMQFGDTHDVMTGTNAEGRLDATDPADTCLDWTSTTAVPTSGGATGGRPGGGGFPGAQAGGLRLGHSWPAGSGMSWTTVHPARSCAAGVNLVQNGPGDGRSVGAGGGWGAIYCFALQP